MADFLQNEIKRIYKENDNSWKKTKPILSRLLKSLQVELSVQEIYNILNNLDNDDILAPCGKEKIFRGFKDGYRFCGLMNSCQCNKEQTTANTKATMLVRYGKPSSLLLPAVKEQRRKTMLERYGVEYTGQSPELVKKMKETSIERYGVENVFLSERYKEQIKNTMIEKYGVDNILKNEDIRTKIQNNNMKKYGSISPLGNKDIREQAKETSLKKYGFENPQSSPLIKEKTKKTVNEKYGVDYLQQSPAIQDKSKKTMLERYGVEHILHCPEFADKRKNTTFERFGVEHAIQAQDIKNKIKATNLERYGFEVSSQNEEVKQKAIDTNIKRYGSKYTAQRNMSQIASYILNDKTSLITELETKSVFTLAEELNVNIATVYRYCKEHDLSPTKSSYETEIKAFLDELGICSITNVRNIITVDGKMRELDVYIPEYRIAIEFNGLYHHSSIFKDNKYHRQKYEACVEKEITLVMINQDEWCQQMLSIKLRLQHLLKLSKKGLPARKLIIHPVSKTIANDFFSKYHIQGATGSIISAFEAVDTNGNMVGAMAFNNQRGTGAIELIRFCSDGDSHAGLFSKMFKYAIKELSYTEVISFADLRYSKGDVYHKNGFELIGEIPPDYRYVVGNKTKHKSNFTKSKLEKIDLLTKNMTEKEATEYLGIPRIYDCGKLKFKWKENNNNV